VKAATNYLGFESQADLEAAVRLTSLFLEIDPNIVTEHDIIEARSILAERRALEEAAQLINDDTEES
jgi:hypothetical protein